jgi:uncharacterized SAM-binding protein YcdF (DUF218 family)
LDVAKHVLASLLLPPVPWLLLIVLGAAWLRRRPGLGWALVLTGIGLIWALGTPAGADVFARWLMAPPPAIGDPRQLDRGPDGGRVPTLILVLGGGRAATAEYPEPTLSPLTMERLRYGLWLGRTGGQEGLPVAYTGGLSPGTEGRSEGELAEAIARDEFHQPLAWVEAQSRDTHENALFSVERLSQQNPPLARLVLVTHDMHQPRALRNFQRARDAAGLTFEIVPAPVGEPVKHPGDWRIGDFLPAPGAIARTRYALREWLGLLAGA